MPARKNIADLRADTDDARFEGAQHWSTTAVAGELLVEVADKADLQLFGQKLRSTPIKMGIDAAGILCREILEIARKSQHGRELVAGLLIEISVADSAVDRAMAEADIRQVAGAIQADRNVAGDIEHVIVDTGVPAIGEYWNAIGKARRVLRERHRSCDGKWSKVGARCRRRVQRCVVVAVAKKEDGSRLAA